MTTQTRRSSWRRWLLFGAAAFSFACWNAAWAQTEATSEKPAAAEPTTAAPAATDTPAPAESGDGKSTAPVTGVGKPTADVEATRAAKKAESLAIQSRRQDLSKALVALIAEAKKLDDYEEENFKGTFTRPHPLLATMDANYALEVINAMLDKFTGNDFRDTYIRWHLMEVVKKARQSDREEMGKRLVKLANMLPTQLNVAAKPWIKYEPPEAYAEWSKAFYSLRRVKGYPPFQTYVDAPASLAEMSAGDRAAAEPVWAKAQELKDSFKTIVDRKAVAFNTRLNQVNYLTRQYRGEIIYELIGTGDPSMMQLVLRTIEVNAGQNTGIQFDLLAFVYLAAFDGRLNLYDEKTLKEFAGSLKKTAMAQDKWVAYGGMNRNFADYAFHMVHMLEDGGGFIDPKELESAHSRKRGMHRPSSREGGL